MMKHVGFLARISAVALSLGPLLAPSIALAGAPTEMSVTPSNQNLALCIYPNILTERAYWTVTLGGGTAGSFTWSVIYGDGTSSGAHTAPGPWAEFDRHHDYDCGNGQADQIWSASRSGGGTAHDYTTVQTGF